MTLSLQISSNAPSSSLIYSFQKIIHPNLRSPFLREPRFPKKKKKYSNFPKFLPLDRNQFPNEIPFPAGKWRRCEMKTDKLRDARLIGTRYRVTRRDESSICGARVWYMTTSWKCALFYSACSTRGQLVCK